MCIGFSPCNILISTFLSLLCQFSMDSYQYAAWCIWGAHSQEYCILFQNTSRATSNTSSIHTALWGCQQNWLDCVKIVQGSGNHNLLGCFWFWWRECIYLKRAEVKYLFKQELLQVWANSSCGAVAVQLQSGNHTILSHLKYTSTAFSNAQGLLPHNMALKERQGT